MKRNDLRSVITATIGRKEYPVVDLIKNNPEMAAIISKLVKPLDSMAQPDRDGNNQISSPDQLNFTSISNDIAQKSRDAESVIELFPDMELAAQILISSILSPKDMAKTELSFIAPNNLRSAEISALMLSRIKEHFEIDYKIEHLLPKILRQMLFETGSYPFVVIPESSVDQLINGTSRITTESISILTDSKTGNFKSIGILGNPDTEAKNKGEPSKILVTAMESMVFNSSTTYKYGVDLGRASLEDFVTVTDNPDMLKTRKLLETVRAKAIGDRIHKNPIQKNLRNANESLNEVENNILASKKLQVGQESTTVKMNDRTLTSLIYKSGRRGAIPFTKIKTQEESTRKTIGAPLIMKLPSESIIPVFTPGNEEDHVGYFVLYDGEGNPLSRTSNTDGYSDLQSMLNNSSNDMSSVLLAKAKKSLGAGCKTINTVQATKIYGEIIENDLLARLRNGAYGTSMSIGKNEEVYRIMLSRVLKQQYTQLVYIPKDLITYFAYKYDNRGIGKSLNDDMRILNSLRAMVLFSKVMAQLKNSIGRTEVRLKLDERDPNPNKTIETAMHEISKTRQQTFPLGMNSPADLVDWVQKSGLEFTFEGHPGIPDVNIEFSEKSSNFTMPDSDLEDDLRKRAIMSFGLNPETVDSGFNSEFATTIVANNLLLAKRVMQIQDVFIPQVSDFVRKITFNHGGLVKDLTEIVLNNYDKVTKTLTDDEAVLSDNKEMICNLIVSEFISNLEVSLPQPNSITLENQMMAFDAYAESLDKALSNYISSDIMSSAFTGEVSERVDEVKAIVKAYFCRKWLAENNVLPELAEMTITDDDGDPLLDFMQINGDHMTGMMKSLVTLIKKQVPIAAAADRDLAKVGDTEPAADLTESDTTTDSDSTGVDDVGGSDDMNIDDLGGGSLPSLDDIQ